MARWARARRRCWRRIRTIPAIRACRSYEQDELNKMAVSAGGCRIPDGLSRHRRSRRADGAGCLRCGRSESASSRRTAGDDARLPLPHRARPGDRSRSVRAVQEAGRHRFHAAEPSADRHELGGGAHRAGARQDVISVEGVSRQRRSAGVRHGLSGRADHARFAESMRR